MAAVEQDERARLDRSSAATAGLDADDREFRLCAWGGIAMLVLFFLALGAMSRFLPPPAPSDSLAQTTEHYREHKDGMVAAGVLMFVAGTFFLAFGAAVSELMRRIAGRRSLLARVQFGACVANSVLFTLVGMLWMTAAYRVDRNPEIVQTLHDMSWLIMIAPSAHIMLQVLTTAFSILGDQRAAPLVPRTVGYAFLLDGAFYVPAWVAGFTDHGPFAWNGLISFWLSVIPFGVWTVAMLVLLFKASARTVAADSPPSLTPA
jgi:hypothetical protein